MLAMATGDKRESQQLDITHHPELPELPIHNRWAVPGWKAQGKTQAKYKPFPGTGPDMSLLWNELRGTRATRRHLTYPRTVRPENSGVSHLSKNPEATIHWVRGDSLNWLLLTMNVVMNTCSCREMQNGATSRNSRTNKMWQANSLLYIL